MQLAAVAVRKEEDATTADLAGDTIRAVTGVSLVSLSGLAPPHPTQGHVCAGRPTEGQRSVRSLWLRLYTCFTRNFVLSTILRSKYVI
jgi:hypothetical protein